MEENKVQEIAEKEPSQEEKKSEARKQLAAHLEAACSELGRTMKDVAYELHMNRTVPERIKNGTLFDTYDMVFARGYVMAFAKTLKMEKKLAESLLNTIYDTDGEEYSTKSRNFVSDYEKETALQNQRHKLIKAAIPIILFILAFGAIIYWKVYIDSTPEGRLLNNPLNSAAESEESVRQPVFIPYIEETRGEEQEEEDPSGEEEDPSGEATADVEQNGQSPQTSSPSLLEFSFLAESWLEIVDSEGQELAWQLFGPGEKVSFRGAPPYQIIIGDGRVTVLKYEGQEISLPINPSDNTARLTIPQEE